MNEKRKKILDQVSKLGYNLELRINNLYNYREKIDLIQKSKIILSITSNDAKTCNTNDLARLSQIVSNNTYIIAEKTGDKMFETISGIDFVDENSICSRIKEVIDNKLYLNTTKQFNNLYKFYNLDIELNNFLKMNSI